MSSRLDVELSDEGLAALDRAIGAGRFAGRTTALQEALRRLLDSTDIADCYRRAYGEHEEDERYGEVGLRLMEECVAEERSDRSRRVSGGSIDATADQPR